MDWKRIGMGLGPVAVVVLGVALASREAPDPGIAGAALVGGDAAWRQDRIWDDGKAEFAVYRVQWPRYARDNPGKALMVLVKEPWAPDLDVKADLPRDDGYDVLKLNHLRDVRTGIYEYHQMASVFFRRETGVLEKVATSSAEACGLTTADLVDGRLQTRSYWDGEGIREQSWPAGVVPEEGLPAMLRDYVIGELPEEITVFPRLMASQYPSLEPRRFKVARSEVSAIETPAGSFQGVRLRLENDDDWMEFDFARERPHVLLRMEYFDGTLYLLAKVERMQYWRRSGVEDERWWPEELR
jgi:hypothetical protein